MTDARDDTPTARRRLDRHLRRAKRDLQRRNPTVDPEDYLRRFAHVAALEAQRRDLGDQA